MEEQIKPRLILSSKEIFSPDPDDPEQMVMILPPQILRQAGMTEGDDLKISLGNQGTIIIEKNS